MTYPYISGAGVYRSESCRKDSPGNTIERRVKKYELELFTDHYQYGTIDGERIDYQKNTILIAKPGNFRASCLPFSCYFIHFVTDDELMCETMNALPMSVRISDEMSYIKLFERISAHFPVTEPTSALEVYGWLMILISKLLRESKLKTDAVENLPDVRSEAILSARSFINLNFSKNISLKDMAANVHLSPNYFHKMFTSVCHITPLEYLMDVRLSKARNLLLTTDSSITQIAERCGFNSYNYFCAVFKKKFGIPPRDFRKKDNRYYEVD